MVGVNDADVGANAHIHDVHHEYEEDDDELDVLPLPTSEKVPRALPEVSTERAKKYEKMRWRWTT